MDAPSRAGADAADHGRRSPSDGRRAQPTRQPEQGYRWGREGGYLVVDDQKAKIQRPPVRSTDGQEQKLGSYALFRRNEPLDEAVWDELLRGPSTRNYGQVVTALDNLRPRPPAAQAKAA